MRLNKPQKQIINDKIRISADLFFDSPVKPPVKQLWFEFPLRFAPIINVTSDPFLVAVLMLAMKRGEDITVEEPISAKLLQGLQKYQERFVAWAPSDYQAINIHAEPRDDSHIKNSALNMSAFSGGVDSFYTLWRHLPRTGYQPPRQLDYALFMNGFDIQLSREGVYEYWAQKYSQALDKFDITLLTGSTNVRNLRVNWTHYHGTALISAAMFFAPHIGSLTIPSSRTPTKKFLVLGTDPCIDPLLSTETLEIIHDENKLTRFDKLKQIGDWEPMFDNLRVCWEKPEAKQNCSRCCKCAFTMTQLDVLGVLSKYKTFLPRSRHAYRMVKYDFRHQRRCGYEVLGYAFQAERRDIMNDVFVAMVRTSLFGELENKYRL